MINAVLLPAVKCFPCMRTFACTIRTYVYTAMRQCCRYRCQHWENKRERESPCKYTHAHTAANSLILLGYWYSWARFEHSRYLAFVAFGFSNWLQACRYTIIHCEAPEKHQHLQPSLFSLPSPPPPPHHHSYTLALATSCIHLSPVHISWVRPT